MTRKEHRIIVDSLRDSIEFFLEQRETLSLDYIRGLGGMYTTVVLELADRLERNNPGFDKASFLQTTLWNYRHRFHYNK